MVKSAFNHAARVLAQARPNLILLAYAAICSADVSGLAMLICHEMLQLAFACPVLSREPPVFD